MSDKLVTDIFELPCCLAARKSRAKQREKCGIYWCFLGLISEPVCALLYQWIQEAVIR